MVGKNQVNLAGNSQTAYSLNWWRAKGHDRDSIIADPHFRNPRHGDFRLSDNSPARRIGFIPFTLDDVGPRRNCR
jgi:hypothetical protein